MHSRDPEGLAHPVHKVYDVAAGDDVGAVVDVAAVDADEVSETVAVAEPVEEVVLGLERIGWQLLAVQVLVGGNDQVVALL